MTNKEKRSKVVSLVESREGKNQYTQGDRRDQVASGWSDCSSLQHWAYKQVGMEIGTYTGAQIDKGEWVTKGGSAPDESKMLPGDLIFFATNYDNGRQYRVGHVEMYVGNGEISGHGSGIGPVRKNLSSYIKQRNDSGKPYIGVKRYIPKDSSDTPAPSNPAEKEMGNVAKGQQWLNTNYGALIKSSCGGLLKVDNDYGAKSRAGALAVFKDVANRKFGCHLTPSNSNFLGDTKTAAANALTKRGSNGTFTYLVQFILSGKHYYFSSMDADFGTGTENAVKSFQRDRGLTVDGQVGANTWYALFN